MISGSSIPADKCQHLYSKTLIVFTFLVPAHSGDPEESTVKRMCVCACVLCQFCLMSNPDEC